MANPNLIMLTDVLNLGFTRTMVEKLLPEPAETRRNPYNRNSMIKLWNKADILAIMQTDTFKELYSKALRRKEAGKKSTETKRRKLEEEVMGNMPEIKIEILPDDKLVDRAIEHWNHWQMLRASGKYACRKDVDKATLDRWVVNYIRHELVYLYDYTTHKMYGRVGRYDIYTKFKGLILDKIAQAYPKYVDECQRQKI